MSKAIVGHKRRLKASCPTLSHSPYELYLNSLAPSGRRAMATLLNHCTLILGHEGIADTFDWTSLTFEKVHLIRTALVDMGYSTNTEHDHRCPTWNHQNNLQLGTNAG